jgi:hypothetical protein
MPPKVLLGTTKGLYEVGSDQPIRFAGREIRALARDDSNWWAVINRREVWRSGPHGEETKVASLETLRANCLRPTPAGLLVAAL